MKILVIGATGALGQAALKLLKEQGHETRSLVRDEEEAAQLRALSGDVRLGDVSRPETLGGLCDGVEIVFSALGKPVSLFSNDETSFHEVDFNGNANVLKEAATHGVTRFIYISIFGSELYGDDFAVARAHRDFERLLKASGLSYTILRPVGLFSGILDLLTMAQRGTVITVGTGEAKTNPIHFEDLARLATDNLEGETGIIEAGGPDIFTRWELGEMACRVMGCENHVRVPDLAAGLALPLLRFYDRPFFDKLAFFKQVLTHDVVAPPFGTHHLEDFLQQAAQK